MKRALTFLLLNSLTITQAFASECKDDAPISSVTGGTALFAPGIQKQLYLHGEDMNSIRFSKGVITAVGDDATENESFSRSVTVFASACEGASSKIELQVGAYDSVTNSFSLKDMGRGCAVGGNIFFNRAGYDTRDSGDMTIASLKYNLGKDNVTLKLECN